MGKAKKQPQTVPQLSLGELGGIVLHPEMLEEQRGAWCSPRKYTDACSAQHAFDADPFTNPRSHLKARWLCMLERGDDGFGLARKDVAGTIYINPRNCEDARDHDDEGIGGGDGHPLWQCTKCGYVVLGPDHRVWIQPPYDIVPQALAHFGHCRIVCLLRLDTSTGWFDTLWNLCEVIMVPRGDRIEFDPPPGVKGDANPFPHGLFYARAEDVPVAISALCYAWPTPRYPWAQDPLGLLVVARTRAAHEPHPFGGDGHDCTVCGEGFCHYLHHRSGCTRGDDATGGCEWCK